MEGALHERPLTIKEAYDALDQFGRDFGRVRLLLLLHAAVPQSFRADLLNLLKVNFLEAETGSDLSVDADVLLSPLVQSAAAGYYRLDPEIRRHCLALLDAAYRDRPARRTVEIARFLLAYAEALERQAGLRLDPLLAEYLAIQRWVAVAFIDPDAAAEAFARALGGVLDSTTPAAALRLGGVTAAISIPLTGHDGLLAYARSLDAIGQGDVATTERLLDWMGDSEIRVGGVTLRPAREILGRFEARPGQAAPAAPAPPAPRLIGVPDRPGIINGRVPALEEARRLLLAPAPGPEDKPPGPNVVSLVGPDGSGKWALANALAHDEAVHGHFADGIIWLGELGHGYPTAELQTYATAAGVTDLLDDRGSVSRARMRSLFVDSRVLFIADLRAASDMMPTLVQESGSGCAVLQLLPTGYKRGRTAEVVLGPLNDVYPEHAFVRLLGGSFPVGPLVELTRGNPLVMRLVEYAVAQRWGSVRQRAVVEELTRVEPRSVREQVPQILRVIWASCSPAERERLGEISKLPEGRTQFEREELTGFGVTNPDEFLGLVYELADVLGTTIRFHPLLLSALNDLVRESAEETVSQQAEANAAEPDADDRRDTVFVSFAREDGAAAEVVMTALRSAGVDARDFYQTLTVGSDLSFTQTEEAIRGSLLFIPIVSKQSVFRSEGFVRREWSTAFDELLRRSSSARFIRPVLIDDTTPFDSEVPPQLRELAWAPAPRGRVSDAFVRDIVDTVRGSRRSRPASSDTATDYAIVIGVSSYPELRIQLSDPARDAEAVYRWLTGPNGVPVEHAHLLVGDGKTADDAQTPDYGSVRKMFEDIVDEGRDAVRKGPAMGRRLYVYFSGLVALADEREPVIVTADSSTKRTRHVAFRAWVEWLRRAGYFDEFVIWTDGRLGSLPQFPVERVPFAPLRSSRPPGSMFSLTATRQLDEGNEGGVTARLLEGLHGAAADGSSGRITSTSLAGFVQQYSGRPGYPRLNIQSDGREIVFVQSLPPA